MLLPDPHDADWETCLAGYRSNRTAVLNRIYQAIRATMRLEDRIDDLNENGGPTAEEDQEITDRLRLQHFLQTSDRDQLVCLRHYIELARVVHKKSDRTTYETIFHNAIHLGIPPHITRAMLDVSVSKNN